MIGLTDLFIPFFQSGLSDFLISLLTSVNERAEGHSDPTLNMSGQKC